ncbi:MAG: AbrB/MazE/SpoVT family DNA-binding domain-containing protein [Promethearchaeia archaeon]
MNNVKIGSHGEIVIKKELREKYGIEPGQEVVELDAGDHIVIIPLSKDPLKKLTGKYSWEETAKELKKKAEELALDEIEKSAK